jgi:hypothetical protein
MILCVGVCKGRAPYSCGVLRNEVPPKGRQPLADKKNASLDKARSVFLVGNCSEKQLRKRILDDTYI